MGNAAANIAAATNAEAGSSAKALSVHSYMQAKKQKSGKLSQDYPLLLHINTEEFNGLDRLGTSVSSSHSLFEPTRVSFYPVTSSSPAGLTSHQV